jgi:hypothetical protein
LEGLSVPTRKKVSPARRAAASPVRAVPLLRVIVFSGDVLRQAAFYRDTFGLKPCGEAWTPGWAELSSGKLRLAFHQAYGKRGPIGKPTGSPLNPHKIVFYSRNVPALRARLLKKGVKMGALHRHEKLVFCDGRDAENHPFQISNRA